MKFKALLNKMDYSKWIWMVIMSMISNFSFAQQDPMYTQYMFNTQTVNPAYAGTWESLGFLTLARQQWAGFEGAPRTFTFSMQSIMKNRKVALGLNVISDQLRFEKRLGIFGDYSYLLKLDDNTNLRFGLKGGFTNYSINFKDYIPYPGSTIDPLFQGEVDTKFTPNFGLGAFLYKTNFYFGLAIPKMLENKFKNNYNNNSVSAEVRHFFLNAGAVFSLSEDLKFKPTFLTKITINAPVEFDFSGNFLLKEKVWLGAMFRTGDSFGFIAQWIFDQKLRIGYAVDFTITELRHYNYGSHEIMVSFELKLTKERFVSPRYY